LVRNSFLYAKWKIYKKIKRINQPVIHIYAVCWNEEKIIPHFINHYSRFVAHFYIYDNYSTDRSEELLKDLKNVTVNKFDTHNKYNEEDQMYIRNHAWKKSIGKADWVIVCDMDEFLYLDSFIPDYLKKAKGTIFQSKGIDMYSDSFPDSNDLLINQIKTGIYNTPYDKSILFSPYKIVEINYPAGSHTADPCGIVRFNHKELTLLHYKNLSLDYIILRANLYKDRISQTNIDKKYGVHYLYGNQRIEREFNENLKKSVKMIN
jgi:hypothetical protein